jgi:hypothetical protein
MKIAAILFAACVNHLHVPAKARPSGAFCCTRQIAKKKGTSVPFSFMRKQTFTLESNFGFS